MEGDKVISPHGRRRAMQFQWCVGRPGLSKRVAAKQVDGQAGINIGGILFVERAGHCRGGITIWPYYNIS